MRSWHINYLQLNLVKAKIHRRRRVVKHHAYHSCNRILPFKLQFKNRYSFKYPARWCCFLENIIYRCPSNIENNLFLPFWNIEKVHEPLKRSMKLFQRGATTSFSGNKLHSSGNFERKYLSWKMNNWELFKFLISC